MNTKSPCRSIVPALFGVGRMCFVAFALTAPTPVLSIETNGRTCFSDEGNGHKSYCRLEANEENYIAWQQATGDEHAYRGKVSLRYWFSSDDDRNVYFRFNNEFDWYLETRESGPVVGRTFNPGIMYRSDKALWIFPFRSWMEWIDTGVEHRSNGQTFDAVANAALAQQADDAKDHRFFDAVSRSSNFFSIQAKMKPHEGGEFYAKAKLFYFDREHQVTWGSLANDSINIQDYDRLNFRYVWKPIANKPLNIDAEVTLGNQGLHTDSWNLGVTVADCGGVPVYLRAHYGPMNNLANYTKSQRTLGIGVVFRPWRN